MSPVHTLMVLFLAGDVMSGRGSDQILPHPSDPVLYEPGMGTGKVVVRTVGHERGGIMSSREQSEMNPGGTTSDASGAPCDRA